MQQLNLRFDICQRTITLLESEKRVEELQESLRMKSFQISKIEERLACSSKSRQVRLAALKTAGIKLEKRLATQRTEQERESALLQQVSEIKRIRTDLELKQNRV